MNKYNYYFFIFYFTLKPLLGHHPNEIQGQLETNPGIIGNIRNNWILDNKEVKRKIQGSVLI